MAYLGNSPGVASQRVESAFTATSSQTVFTPSSGYTLGYCDVYQNGVKLVNGDDYTAADGATVTLATGAATGDSIVIVASFPRGLSDGYLKSEADAKFAPIAAPTFTGVATFSKGSSSGVTIGDVTTNSNSVLRMQGTSAGKNWQIANNLNVTGIEFTPSTADGGTTYTTPAVTFLSSGNVGIGTSSPTAKLQVSATTGEYIRVNGKSSAVVSSDLTISRTSSTTGIVQAPNLYFDDGTTNNTRAIQCGQGNQQFWAYRNGWIEDMRIDSSGNLLVGATSQVLNGKFTVKGTHATITSDGLSSSAQLSIQAHNGSGYNPKIYFECPGLIGAGIELDRGAAQLRAWVGTGTAGVSLAGGGTSWGSYSDERLKDIIEPITNASEKVATLRTVIGRYKTDDAEKRRVFLIAQDVQAVLPEAVYQNSDEDDTLSLAYTDVIPLMIAAFKEQQAIIEQLQADVATLKGTP